MAKTPGPCCTTTLLPAKSPGRSRVVGSRKGVPSGAPSRTATTVPGAAATTSAPKARCCSLRAPSPSANRPPRSRTQSTAKASFLR